MASALGGVLSVCFASGVSALESTEQDFSERLLTAAEVAERLHVPETWVREQTRAGQLPYLELGRYRRYEWSAVVAWLEDQRAGQWRKHRPRVAVAGARS